MFHIVAITDVLSRTIKYTVTGFTTPSRVIHNTTGKITAAIIHRRVTSLIMVPRLGESSVFVRGKETRPGGLNKAARVRRLM